MRKSILHSLLGAIYKYVEAVDEIQATGMDMTIRDNLDATATLIIKHYLSEHSLPVGNGKANDEGEAADDWDAQVEEAYNILKTESKPGPTLVSRTMKVSMTVAKKLYKELVDSGRLTKGKKPKEEKKKSSIADLVKDLPKGDDLMVPAHLQPLLLLPKERRAPYLTGLKLDELVDANDVARVTANGLDSTLVDEIIGLSRSRPKKASASDIIVAKKDGSELEQKYFRLRSKFAGVIPNGKALYAHMVTGGFTKRVLSDLKMIATAIKENQG